MSATTIKEWLVAIGFKTDRNSEREVDKTIERIKTSLAALGTGAAAYAGYKWLDNMTTGMEKLYYASQRAGESVGRMQASMYAASQLGSSSDQAAQAAVTLNQWLARNPNGEANIRANLGIVTRDADGKLLGGAELDQRIAQAMKRLPDWRQNQLSDLYGIPLEYRMALQNGSFDRFENEANQVRSNVGLDPQKTAENAHLFQVQLRRLGLTMQVVGESITSSLVGSHGVGGILERFNAVLLAHLPQITALFNKFAASAIPAFGRLLDYLGTVDWDAVFGKIQSLVEWLLPEKKSPRGFTDSDPAFSGENKSIWMGAVDAFRATFLGDEAANRRAWRGEATDHPLRWPVNPSGDFHPTRQDGTRSLHPLLLKAGRAFGLPDWLMDALVNQESGGNPNAVSSKGARGLGQFMPATAAQYGSPNNPFNIARLLAHLSEKYHGNIDLILAAYNAGEGNVDRYGGIPPFKETQKYVRSIKAMIANPASIDHPHRHHKKDAGQTYGPSLTSETHIHVNGAGDPNAVAGAVSGKIDGSNQRLLRNARQVWA